MRVVFTLFLALSAACALPGAARAGIAEQAAALLRAKCTECHDDDDGSGGLSLTTREGALRGGKKGLRVVPGDPAASALLDAVARRRKPAMPPDDPLAPAEIELLRAWVAAGAPWPAGDTPKGPRWWSFKPPQRPPVPPASPWARTPIDAFIAKALRDKGLSPAPEADRRTYIRRATFDLWGLPPTEDEAAAFERDRAPGAHERLVDRLLASPHYGEQSGRRWLDLVRYGDTAGFEHDPFITYAWRYRDWVIDAFNEDRPYDVFVQQQLAGDELWPDDPKAQVGTGFFTVGPNRDMQFKVEDVNRVETITDYVDTTGGVFLGLTIGCARCHDHKLDPISQKDYYRLAAIFAPAIKTRIFLDYNKARFRDIGDNYREQRLLAMSERIALAQAEEDRAALDDVKERLVKMFTGFAPGPFAVGVTDVGREAPATYLPGRVDEAIRPGFLRALGGGDIAEPPREATSTGRRRALARWITRADHPLTARVIVNRIWQQHFGRGLVATVSDFGTRGAPPSHPELLDWLAADLPAGGWSLKRLHRMILLSSAYRQTSAATARAASIDPENRWLARAARRRLDAEEIRDAMLRVAGALNEKRGGRAVTPPLSPEELFGIGGGHDSWIVTPDPAEHARRSVYLLHRRTFQTTMMAVFDGPDGMLTCPRREASTTAPQALALFNGAFTTLQARRLAARAAASAQDGSPRAAAEALVRAAFGRPLAAAEAPALIAFLDKQTRATGSRTRAAEELARALLNANEFLYVD